MNNQDLFIPITTSTKFNRPSQSHEHPIVKEGGEGIQKFWRYENGWGVSAVRFKIKTQLVNHPIGSYGVESNLWEIAILRFDSQNERESGFSISYLSGITNDVIGYLTEKDIEKYLLKVKNLKSVWNTKRNINKQ